MNVERRLRSLKLLAGVRVLDLGRLMPSAIVTAELAKMGADIVKVELPPHGDYFRATPPYIRGRGDMHLNLNRSKRSLCLDFRAERGREILLRLAARANVLLDVSRPGTMEGLGLGYADVRKVNPAIIYASISGYGQDGPYHALPAHGLSADTSAGMLDDFDAAGIPRIPDNYVSVGPRACGLYGAIAVLGALYHQRATGEGQYLDVSQGDATVAWNYRNLDTIANGGAPMPSYNKLGPRHTFYRTSDGKFILFAATERKFWRTFCESVNRPELDTDDSGQIVSYAEDDAMRRSLAEIIGGRTRDEWVAFGIKTGVPIAPLVERHELPGNVNVMARRMVAANPHPLGGTVMLTAHPVKFAGHEVAYAPAPEMGEHNAEILRECGFLPAEIEALAREGIVVDPAHGPAGDGGAP